jgi:predicted transcriptional regulator
VDDPLELENRRRIYQEVTLNPGLHYRELQRRLGMPPGLLDHHLAYLQERDMLAARKEGNYTRYYASHRISESGKKALSALRQEIPRAVLVFLLMNPGSTHSDILASLTVSGATLSYHLKKMVKASVVSSRKKGRFTHFEVVDPEEVATLLITYQKSFVDGLVDSFVRLWSTGDGGA